MSGYETPLVLVTRPEAASRDFVAALKAICPTFCPLISPAFELESVEATIPPFDEAVFTSRAGVQFGPAGGGRKAWCVGTSTTSAAQKAGYDAHNADGNAEALVDVILAARPAGRLLHLRGESSTGDVAEKLTEGGLNCGETTVYRKAAKTLAEADRAQLEKSEIVILPVFSAETVTIIAGWGLDLSRNHVVAISQDAADAALALAAAKITIAEVPDRAAMTQATARLIA